MATGHQTERFFELEEQLVDIKQLILYNDDVNTFDHVIDSLIKICGHEPEQAEQCAHIVHYKGKCGVKSGEFEKLRPMCEALLDRGISAVIE
jgi:ATP-dependent Clp protease adaptor protein ClpS